MTSFDVRLGPDPDLVDAHARASALEQQVDALEGDLAEAERTTTTDASGAEADDEPGGSEEGGIEQVSLAPRCDTFPDQEAAQVAYDADHLALADLDGDGDGRACEQLKSSTAARAWGGAPPPTESARSAEDDDGTTESAAAASSAGSGSPALSTSASSSSSTDAAPAVPSTSTTTPAPVAPPAAAMPDAPSKDEIVASDDHFGLAAATTEEYDDLEWRLATDTTIRSFYTGFDSDLDQDRIVESWRRGEIPMLTWESRPLTGSGVDPDASLERIAAGELDDYLVRYAQDVAALGLPIVIRFDHEMNGDWYRWSETNPAYGNPEGSYVAAWRHIHDVFEAHGANEQVIWLWSPNRVDNIGSLPAIDRYWPGREYVDWVGMTGYMRQNDAPSDFAGTYDATLDELRRVAPGVPILLSEVGATEVGGAKLDFVESFFPGLAANPDVIGFVWFNYVVSEDGTTNDWRIDSTTAVFDAFREGLRASPFGVVWRDGQVEEAAS